VEETTPAAGPGDPPAAGRTAPVVLVAEDSRTLRSILRGQLLGHGYQVLEADDGEQAIAVCRRERPDVVLLDVEMPRMDGHLVLGTIKRDPALTDLPVVFVTARVTTEDVVKGLDLGAHDYLRKPFEPSELLARVHAALRTKRLQDQLRQRNAELDRVSRTDALTGLHNRRHLEERLTEQASLVARHGGEIGVLLVDVDRFKRINDERGHAVGDAVLRVLAGRLREALRAEDVPGRWGGEEFLVLLPATGRDGVGAVGERVRRAVADDPFQLTGDQVEVTVSVGAAAGMDDGWEGLVRRADTALYAAKESGRNRVVLEDGTTLGQQDKLPAP
jgi:two-component system, cell cycle response regulator